MLEVSKQTDAVALLGTHIGSTGMSELGIKEEHEAKLRRSPSRINLERSGTSKLGLEG